MAYRVEFVSSAKEDLQRLRKTDQVKVLDQVERHLSHQPTLQSKSRIKALRPGTFPPYRLRIDEFRVYYDVDETLRVVAVYGVMWKERSEEWLRRSSERRQKGEKP